MNLKYSIDQLALLGGKPSFEKKLYVGCPNIGSEAKILERFRDILERRWLSNDGPYVQELESRIAKMVGVKHCIATCNATVALEIAIRALGLSGEVIVPAFTFVATPHSLQWQEITPVFCDIEADTHHIDAARIEQLLTPRTTGILAVHLWGRPCKVDQLSDIARKHGIKLLFDAAHAFGCSCQGRMVGSFGDAEVFSFHATKFFNTFEGGAVMTNNDALANRIRLMRNFGFSGYDQVIYLGTNGKMSEVSAAMGLTNLESLPTFVCLNQRNHQYYTQGLKDTPGIHVLPYNEPDKCNYQYIVLEVDDNVTQVTRDELVKILWAENIIARRYFYPGCHRMEPYRSYFPNAGLLLPNTERLCRRVMTLPTGAAVGPDEITVICSIIQLVLKNADKVCERMRKPQIELEAA